MAERTVSEIGERGLIERIAAKLGGPAPDEVWTGDDAAVVLLDDSKLLLTTDVMVEGIDFDLGYAGGSDVGWKAIAINASDAAAMGCRPRHALATLSVPSDTALSFVDGLLEGMVEAAARWEIALVGGDISRAAEICVGVAMTGVPGASGPVLRSGARPGDAICVTGSLGGAAGGLLALRKGMGVDALVRRQLRPQARVDEGVLIAGAGASAMIDVSDGLAVDLGHIIEASGVGCEVDPAAIPIDRALEIESLGRDPLDLALLGGEDFELLFTISEGRVEEVRSGLAELRTDVTRIGTVTRSGARLGTDPLSAWEERGWDHLLSR